MDSEGLHLGREETRMVHWELFRSSFRQTARNDRPAKLYRWPALIRSTSGIDLPLAGPYRRRALKPVANKVEAGMTASGLLRSSQDQFGPGQNAHAQAAASSSRPKQKHYKFDSLFGLIYGLNGRKLALIGKIKPFTDNPVTATPPTQTASSACPVGSTA